MTGARRFPYVRVLIGSAVAVALSATIGLSAPKPAQAATRAKTITRSAVIDRSKLWVKHRVPYSQRGSHMGYRRDCSGYVSFAWKVGRSYTTRTLHKVSHRVSLSQARPGDAVLYKGHVVVFGGWKNRSAGTFYAYEEPTWGKVARKKVKSVRGGKVMRRDGIRDTAPKPAVPTGSTTETVSSSMSM